uniref:Uncharacterized protein n=1 Tax=Arion vulgaris TaxID=1028688 RepID=A0A0B7BG22_9EUPU
MESNRNVVLQSWDPTEMWFYRRRCGLTVENSTEKCLPLIPTISSEVDSLLCHETKFSRIFFLYLVSHRFYRF